MPLHRVETGRTPEYPDLQPLTVALPRALALTSLCLLHAALAWGLAKAIPFVRW